MHTYFLAHESEDLPLACTISVHTDDSLMAGTISRFYPHRCLIDSDRSLTPVMRVSLSLHLSDTARVRLGLRIVRWTRKGMWH